MMSFTSLIDGENMPTVHNVGLPYTLVESSSSVTATFVPGTPWMDAASVGKVRPTYDVVYVTGNLQISFGYQTCNVENSPDTAVGVGSYNGAGMAYPGSGYTDIAANTAPKQLVRLGWLVKLSSGSTQSFGCVGGSCTIMECD